MKQYFFILLMLSSCRNEKPLIEEKLMVDMICDMQVAEAMAIKSDTISANQNKMYKALQHDLFEKNKITERQFDSAYTYYMSDMKRAQVIYDQVMVKLSERQLKLQ
jgi:hypothetical protein